MQKLKMLQPRLKTLNTDVVPVLGRSGYPVTQPKRWTKADNGRTLPLTSAAWRKLRRHVLSSEPLCRMCTAQGLTVPATDVDHRDNNPANNELVNLQPLCHMHHGMKTAIDMGGNVRMGCATDGQPLDPSHHWNRPATAHLATMENGILKRSPATERHEPTVLPCFNANRESVA